MKKLRAMLKSKIGQTATETILVVPALAFLFYAMVDISLAYLRWYDIRHATEVATRAAAVTPMPIANIKEVALETLRNNLKMTDAEFQNDLTNGKIQFCIPGLEDPLNTLCGENPDMLTTPIQIGYQHEFGNMLSPLMPDHLDLNTVAAVFYSGIGTRWEAPPSNPNRPPTTSGPGEDNGTPN